MTTCPGDNRISIGRLKWLSLNSEFCQSDQPWVQLTDTDVISRSDRGCFELLIKRFICEHGMFVFVSLSKESVSANQSFALGNALAAYAGVGHNADVFGLYDLGETYKVGGVVVILGGKRTGRWQHCNRGPFH